MNGLKTCLLIGAGSAGQRHARAVRALAPDITIVALRSGRGPTLPPGLVDREIYDPHEAASLRPDMAIVADPAPLHPGSASPFLSQGVPVLIEKPLAVDDAGAQSLLAAGRGNSRILVGYILRHDPGLTAFRDALRAGMIGRLVTLHLEAGQALADWRPNGDAARSISARLETGGGVMFELSHEIDAARWLLGEIEAVHALAGARGDAKLSVEDTAVMALRAASGDLALIQIDMARGVARRCYRAIGTAGTLIWSAGDGEVRLEQPAGDRVIHAEPPDRDALFRRQMAHFLDVARGQAAPLCSLEDGAHTLATVLRARSTAGLDTIAA